MALAKGRFVEGTIRNTPRPPLLDWILLGVRYRDGEKSEAQLQNLAVCL
jgi:hypothetical protein